MSQCPKKSRRFIAMMNAAEEYFRLLQEGNHAQKNVDIAERKFHELSECYSDDPAFVAILKLEREAAKNGASAR